jgi:ketosteroid isomerase-like protein
MADRAELARAFLAAFSAGDVDAACAITHPDVEFVAIAERVTGPLPSGHDGLREWFDASARTWERIEATESEWEAEERDGWMILSGETTARARETGRDMEWPWTAVARVDDGGRITRFGIYLSRDEALRSIEG